jgi:tetratricopeptide (TPR) repeat protein
MIMAKIKSVHRSNGAKKKRAGRNNHNHQPHDSSISLKSTPETPEQMCLRASELFYQVQVDRALSMTKRALDTFKEYYPDNPQAPYPAFVLLGQIYLARGEVELSREHYLKAIEVDPDGQKIGAAPFLWIAQLCEEGGEESIKWFEKASVILRRELKRSEEHYGIEEAEDEINEIRRQLGETLCSMTEVYMTDLS